MADRLRHYVYAAQTHITGRQCWTSTRDAAAFIRYMERDVRFRERFPDHKPVRVFRLKDRGASAAFYRHRTHGIYLPYWAQDQVHLIHELTHGVLPLGVHHGPQFVRTLHWMIATFMSDRAAAQLAYGLELNGIKALHYDDAGRPVQAPCCVV